MSGTTPPALDADWPAIAAHAAHHDIVNPAEALASWRVLDEERRVNWRASADAVRMLLDAERDQAREITVQPDPGGPQEAYEAYVDTLLDPVRGEMARLRAVIRRAPGESDKPVPDPGAATAKRVPELGAVAYEAAETGVLRDQLAAADRATADFRRQCSELAGELGAARAVVREMDAHIASGDDYADPAKRIEWRQRAGIGDAS